MKQIIKIESLHRRYELGKSAVHALRGASLVIHEGERVFFGGPSGSGKSTLLHLLGGLDRPDEGAVWIAGQRIDLIPDDELSGFRARNIGFVFQNFNLLPMLTVAENVEYPLLLNGIAEREQRVKDILAEVGLAEFASHYPNELSGGQRQRVAIARALVHQPLLLIADEPTANLDSATGEHVMQLMLELSRKRGSTVLICTHNNDFLARAERLVMMCDGQITSDKVRSDRAPNANQVQAVVRSLPSH